MSRIAPLVNDLIGTESADELLVNIMGALGDSAGSVSYTHLTLPTKRIV